MKKSFQQIEDYYIRKGLKGSKLRKTLKVDKEYQEILSERKKKLTKKFKITLEDEKRYVLSTDQDYKILDKIKQLEKQKLGDEDKKLVKFIRTQLKDDWRTPIMKLLDRVLKKYK